MIVLIVTKEKLEFLESENFSVPTPISLNVLKGAWCPVASYSMRQVKWYCSATVKRRHTWF